MRLIIDMVYQIVIPTYGRPELLQEKTLSMLHKYKIPKQQITLFVANKKEYDIYYSKVAEPLYGSIVIGVPGLMQQRNFIMQYYPVGTQIVSFDDDVSGLWQLEGGKLVPLVGLKQVIQNGFALCKRLGYHMWGIYPTKNAGWMSPEPSINLKFLIGHMYGIINRKIVLHAPLKHDYELSLENAVRDGGVVRLNDIVATTKMGKAGGIGKTVEERQTTYNKVIPYLLKKYPGLVRVNPRREGEILLAREIKSASDN
jgi:hypothetical protein